jgi:ectoine hydroxylase-related dioxygenase (phytanoyl-CoA dioxygenase family)
MVDPEEQASNTYGVLIASASGTAIERIAEQVRVTGYGVLDSGLSADEILAVTLAFERTRMSYLSRFGDARLTSMGEQHTIRAMLAHGEMVFRQLATQPRVLEVVSHLICGRFLLNQQNGIINPPDQTYVQGKWHRDLPYQHFVSSRPLAINALYCVDDFTIDNGATLVLPGTHKVEAFPSPAFAESSARHITAKAGSFLIIDCMLYHKGGVNQSGQARRAVNHVYTIPYIKQQISLPRQLCAQGLTQSEKQLFGFDCPEHGSVDEFLMRHEHD